MTRFLRAVVGAVLLCGTALVPTPAVAAAPAESAVLGVPAPGYFTGLGFDACSAPSLAAMDAWLASPYRAVGVYFGGANRACAQPNLTPDWVAHQQVNGWHLLPIYLGLQAPCTTSTKKYRIDPAQAAVQGRAEADAAVTAAAALGLPTGSALIFDMEAYQVGNAACSTAVLDFLGAWTSRLHDRGYLSGVYASIASGVTDLVKDYASSTRPHPDYLDFARWDGVAGATNPAIPTAYWSPHRRIHQYLGPHDETYGGVTINVDLDYVDVRPPPAPPFGDFNGNGWSDLLARDARTGYLYLYPGNGTSLESRVLLGYGWGSYPVLTRLGDFDRDGHEDVIALNSGTGTLYLYRGTGSGLRPQIRIGAGWNTMREITAVGDLNGDHYPDLLAVLKSTGDLYLYPGRGTAFAPRVRLGGGWNAMSELTGIGDLTGDGRPDLLARNTASGVLYLYPGRGTGFGPRASLGAGWGGRRSLVGVGDFDQDGHPDLLSVIGSTGTLYLNRGRTGGLAPAVAIPHGWWSYLNPLT